MGARPRRTPTSDETPPRNKRRKLCTRDKVLKLDTILLMSGAGYTAAKPTKSMSMSSSDSDEDIHVRKRPRMNPTGNA